MPILPIDDGRYANPEMMRIFEEDVRVQRMLDVEAALAWAHAEVGNIPREDAEKIVAMASLEHVKLSRIKEIERETKHDVVALIRALAEACGMSGAYVHLGAASSDVTDTATALQLKDALGLIEKKLCNLQETLSQKVSRSKEATAIRDSAIVLAIPSFGFIAWAQETSRNIERLRECKKRVLVGKMSGAVGTQAAFGLHAAKIQELVMKRLNIKAAEISTQIVQRDRHAELACLLAIVAASLESIASVILESRKPKTEKFFEKLDRADSSRVLCETSETCETVCGLGRIARSLLVPALENMSTRHEQDLTQSSSERFVIPQTCILVDYMLFLINRIVNVLEINADS